MSAVVKNQLYFRPIQMADIKSVHEIESVAYVFPWSRTIFYDCIRIGHSFWGLENDDILIAYGIISIVPSIDESHILNLCVHPDMQGLGFGKIMLHFLLDLAKEYKARSIFLEVRPSNIAALKLYKRYGFKQVGMRRNYYQSVSGREDALILTYVIG